VGGIDAVGLRAAWDAAGGGDAAPLRSALDGRGRGTVIDWAYTPPHAFPMVRALQRAGIAAWWLDADAAAAEGSFRRRGTGSPWDFFHHAFAVGLQRNQIQALYGARYLLALRAGGRREEPEEIWRAICAVEGWDAARAAGKLRT